MYKQNQNINNKIQIIKNNQILELKSTKTKTISLDWFNSTFKQAKRSENLNIGQLKLPSLRSRNKREWRKLTGPNSLKEYHQEHRYKHHRTSRRKSVKEHNKIYEEIMAKNFQNLTEDVNIQIQEDNKLQPG